MLDLDRLADELVVPVAKVETSVGTLFVSNPAHALNVGDMLKAEKLPEDDRGTYYATRLVSRSPRANATQEFEPLEPEALDALSDNDVDALAVALRNALARMPVANLDATDQAIETRAEDVSARAYFARVVEVGTGVAVGRIRTISSKHGTRIGQSLVDLHVKGMRLGKTVGMLDGIRFPLKPAAPSINDHPFESLFAKQAQLQVDDRQRAQLMSQASVDSARLLQQLAETAEGVMVRVLEQDRKLDSSTRIQLWIALGAFVFGVLLSGISVVFAVLSFYQDQSAKEEDLVLNRATASRDERISETLSHNQALLEQNAELLREVAALREAGMAVVRVVPDEESKR